MAVSQDHDDKRSLDYVERFPDVDSQHRHEQHSVVLKAQLKLRRSPEFRGWSPKAQVGFACHERENPTGFSLRLQETL